MRKYLILVLIIIAITGCAALKEEKQVEKKIFLPEDFKRLGSMNYYSYYEYEKFHRNFNKAFENLRIAEQLNPQSVYLKELIFDFIYRQASHDSSTAELMTKLGKKWHEQGNYSSRMMYQLSHIYLSKDDVDSAKVYFEECVKGDTKREYYLAYYLFTNEYFPPADSIYLEKAVAGNWEIEDKDVIYQAVNIYNGLGKIQRAKKLLETAYHDWHELQALLNLLPLNRETGEEIKNIGLLEERNMLEGDLPDHILEYLITLYFEHEMYDKVMAMEEECRSTGNKLIMKLLFYSAFQAGDQEIINRITELLKAADYLDENDIILVYINNCSSALNEGNIHEALKYFNETDNITRKLHFIYFMDTEREQNELITEFLDANYNEAEDKNEALFMLVMHNLITLNREVVHELLPMIDMSYLKDQYLLRELGGSFKELPGYNFEDLEFISKLYEDDNYILGMLYYYLGENDEARQKLSLAHNENDLCASGAMILGNLLLNAEKEEELIELLEWSIQTYPDSSDILNFYGYQVAVYAKEGSYLKAEQALLKALESSPDNAMYWDSLGWLYYRMNRFDEALEAMQKTQEVAEKHSEIAFHYGVILYEAGFNDLALFYLNHALTMQLDEVAKADAEILIKRILEKE